MILLSERNYRLALRRRQSHQSWDAIAAEIGGVDGDDLRQMVEAKSRRAGGARKALAARPRTLPSVAIGRSADADQAHQNLGVIARRIGALRKAERDPLDDMIHPSALRR
jgi:predicted HAD superfamily phosphohydrolase